MRTETIVLAVFALGLVGAAFGLIRAAIWLRRTGRSVVTEAVGAVLLVAFGAGGLLRLPPSESRGFIIMFAFFLFAGCLWAAMLGARFVAHARPICCSFCGKSQRDVKTIIQAAHASICNECVGICEQTLTAASPA